MKGSGQSRTGQRERNCTEAWEASARLAVLSVGVSWAPLKWPGLYALPNSDTSVGSPSSPPFPRQRSDLAQGSSLHWRLTPKELTVGVVYYPDSPQPGGKPFLEGGSGRHISITTTLYVLSIPSSWRNFSWSLPSAPVQSVCPLYLANSYHSEPGKAQIL